MERQARRRETASNIMKSFTSAVSLFMAALSFVLGCSLHSPLAAQSERGGTIAVKNPPPPPWTPVGWHRGDRQLECWGRRVTLNSLGFPSQIVSQDFSLLQRPIELSVQSRGRRKEWHAAGEVRAQGDESRVVLSGLSRSDVGELDWTCTAEFDGLVRWDLLLRPKPETEIDELELTFAMKPREASLYYAFLATGSIWGDTRRGSFPSSALNHRWSPYFWMGNEDVGLAAFCETDKAWIGANDVGFSMHSDREAHVVAWKFISKPTTLKEPWKFTFAIQPTPTKPMPAKRLRLTPLGRNGQEAISVVQNWNWPESSENLSVLWSTPDLLRHYGYPEATDPERFQATVDALHQRGLKVLPYSLLTCISTGSPVATRFLEWCNDYRNGSSSDVRVYGDEVVGILPTESWIDFIVEAQEQFVRRYKLDGIYNDISHVIRRHTIPGDQGVFPILGTRELYKRMYISLSQIGREQARSLHSIAHISTEPLVPVITFATATVDGETFRGKVDGDYFRLMPMDEFRAEFLGRRAGVASFLLPQIPSKDAREKRALTRQVLGLTLLHDVGVWPFLCDVEEVRRVYEILDGADWDDRKFSPYWKAGPPVPQAEGVFCSAFEGADRSYLLCLVNTQDSASKVELPGRWGVLKALDIQGTACLSKSGLFVELPPLDFALLLVK